MGSLRQRRLLGLGRVCVDAYARRVGAQARWDGRKWGVRPIVEALGGSIPRLLSVATAAGGVSTMVGAVNPNDAGGAVVADGLAAAGITPALRPCRRTAQSWVVVDDDDGLQLVCSVEEDADDRYPRASIRELDLTDVWCVALDPRHLEAATALAQRCNEEGIAVFLDPGTSAYAALDRGRMRTLYAHVDVVCADDAFFDWIGDADGPATVLHINPAGVTTATCLDGEVTAAVPEGDLIGSSLGCGDYFRGGILTSLLARANSREEIRQPGIARLAPALELGRRLSTFRKTDTRLLPRLPEPGQLATWLREL